MDWVFAGWYPNYWKYSVAMVANGGWLDDWHSYANMALDEFPTPYPWFSTMIHEIWC